MDIKTSNNIKISVNDDKILKIKNGFLFNREVPIDLIEAVFFEERINDNILSFYINKSINSDSKDLIELKFKRSNQQIFLLSYELLRILTLDKYGKYINSFRYIEHEGGLNNVRYRSKLSIMFYDSGILLINSEIFNKPSTIFIKYQNIDKIILDDINKLRYELKEQSDSAHIPTRNRKEDLAFKIDYVEQDKKESFILNTPNKNNLQAIAKIINQEKKNQQEITKMINEERNKLIEKEIVEDINHENNYNFFEHDFVASNQLENKKEDMSLNNFEKIKEAKKLLDMEAISESEYKLLKEKLLKEIIDTDKK